MWFGPGAWKKHEKNMTISRETDTSSQMDNGNVTNNLGYTPHLHVKLLVLLYKFKPDNWRSFSTFDVI